MKLAGRVAIVTAAGSGIGRACARRYAHEGAHVVVNSLRPESCAAVADEIVEQGGSALCFAGDVSRPEVIGELFATALAIDGRVDIVHNNAADPRGSFIVDTTDEQWRATVSLTLDSVFYATRAALRAMIPRRRGVIINTTSSSGLGGVSGFGAYGAAKAAVENLTRTTAIENAQYGIRVNAICPGTVESRSTNAWFGSDPTARTTYEAQIPQHRLGAAEEIANVAAFLASDEASYIIGATVVVDGGVAARVALPFSTRASHGHDR